MDTFGETCNLPKPNQQEMKHLNRPITSNDMDSGIRTLATNKSPEPDVFKGESYQTFQALSPILLQLFQKTGEKGKLSDSFNETSITLMPKLEKHTFGKKGERQANIADKRGYKSTQQNNSKPNPTIH